MLTDIIKQLAQEYGVPIIIDEKADLNEAYFEMLMPSCVPSGTIVIACDRGPNLWLEGLAEYGQIIIAKSPELRYLRQIENGGQNG